MVEISSYALQYTNVDYSAVAASSFDLFITEGAPKPRPGSNPALTDAQVAALVAQGRVVVGYVDVGVTDANRGYWNTGWTNNGDDLGTPTGSAPSWLVGQPHNAFGVLVKFWDPAWQQIVIDQAVDLVNRGYSGVFLDDIGIYYPLGGGDDATIRLHADEMAEFVANIASAIRAVNPNAYVVANADPYLVTNMTLDARGTAAAASYLAAVNAQLLENKDAAAIDYAQTSFAGETRLILESDGSPAFTPAESWARGILYTSPTSTYNALGTAAYPATGGDDVLTGGDGPNHISGGGGNDRIDGRAGSDYLDGGTGNDLLITGKGADTVDGGDGNDVITGYLISTYIYGSEGASVIDTDGNSGDGYAVVGGDALRGNAGDDEIYVGYGSSVDGGSGIDYVHLALTTTWVPWVAHTILNTTNSLGITVDLADAAASTATLAVGGGYTGLQISLTGVERFDITFGSGDDLVYGGAYDDTLRGESYNFAYGNDELHGRGGNDTLDGSGGADKLYGDDGNDTLDGGVTSPGFDDYARDDLFGGNNDDTLIGRLYDHLDGGSGNDTATLSLGTSSFAYNIDMGLMYSAAVAYDLGDGTTVVGIEHYTRVTLGSGNDHVTGSALSETIDTGAGADFLDGGAGNDTMIGGTGDDVYVVDSLLDVVTEGGGGGTDEVRTSIANFALPANVERLVYTGSGDATMTGNSGDNVFTGNTGSDYFDLSQGGSDTASGGGGSDGFYLGKQLSAGDSIDGGAGGDDQLGVQGNYSYTFAAGNLVNIETLAILSGHDTRFGDLSGASYGYNLTTVNANVAAGATLIVNANNLAAGENLTFNGSAETDGSFFFYAGLGTDNLTGGQQSDGFFFGEGGRFSPTDHVDGQGGTDDQLGIRGDYSALTVFSSTSIVGIETLALLSAQDSRFAAAGTAYSYNIRLDDANVAAGATLTVSGNNLRSNESLAIDGSGETNGSFRFFSGAGADTLKGGANADLFIGGLGQDSMTGNGGNDTFYLRTTAESAVGAARDQITDFTVGDHIDLSAIDAIVGCGNDAFTFLATGAFTSHAGEARIAGSGASWTLQVDTNGDGVADMEIGITTTGGHVPVAADFVL